MASTVRRVRWRVSAFERWRKLGPLCSLKSANISRSLLQKRKPTANPRGQVLLLLLLKGGGEGGHPAEKEISSNGRAVGRDELVFHRANAHLLMLILLQLPLQLPMRIRDQERWFPSRQTTAAGQAPRRNCPWLLDQLHLQRRRHSAGGGATVHYLGEVDVLRNSP
ncbi:hypothetical protein ACFX14_045476 [Malus domestica]